MSFIIQLVSGGAMSHSPLQTPAKRFGVLRPNPGAGSPRVLALLTPEFRVCQKQRELPKKIRLTRFVRTIMHVSLNGFGGLGFRH